MKLKEAMRIISEGWIQRKKGFRVRFEKRVGHQWVTDCFPNKEEKPLSSQVSAWELARRFAESNPLDRHGIREGDIVNVSVVDDLDRTIDFYGSNEPTRLNPFETAFGPEN
jgi:hypothetical protein